MKPPVMTREGATALGQYIEARLKECREELEDSRLDEKPIDTVACRARINELKDILDQFDIPTA